MSEQLKRWALRLYNDCGGYSPEMVDPQTLPDPTSRTAYVLEADAGAALAAKDARIAKLESALRLAQPCVERDMTAAVKENFGRVGNDPWACAAVDARDAVHDALASQQQAEPKPLRQFIAECEARDPQMMAEAREWAKTVAPLSATPSEDGANYDKFYAGLYHKSSPMWKELHDLAVSKGYDHVRFAIECAPVYKCDCMGARKVAIDTNGKTRPCECVESVNKVPITRMAREAPEFRDVTVTAIDDAYHDDIGRTEAVNRIVAQHSRIVAAKDWEISTITAWWRAANVRALELEEKVSKKDAEIARLKAYDAEAIKRPPYAHICIGMPAALHHDTRKLLERFTHALAVKLRAAEEKYGYSNGWKDAGWMDECRAKLAEHMAKGDPRDVAAYCAFLWHHGESTAQPARQGGGDGRVRRVLLLTSYCGDDSEGCTDATPCAECLKMCNVALTSGDMKVIGGFGSQAALAPAAVMMPSLEAISAVLQKAPTSECKDENSIWRRAARELDAIRLNRRAIPVELLERICNSMTLRALDNAVGELRTLLGKDGE